MLQPQDTHTQKKASVCGTQVRARPRDAQNCSRDSRGAGASWNVGTHLVVTMTGIS